MTSLNWKLLARSRCWQKTLTCWIHSDLKIHFSVEHSALELLTSFHLPASWWGRVGGPSFYVILTIVTHSKAFKSHESKAQNDVWEKRKVLHFFSLGTCGWNYKSTTRFCFLAVLTNTRLNIFLSIEPDMYRNNWNQQHCTFF